MATTVAHLQAVLTADTGKFDRSMDSSDKKVGGFRSGVQKHWGAITVGATAALGGIVAGAKVAVDAASDLNEQISKSAQVFGPASKDIVAWSKTTASSIGVSRRQALEMTGTFGNMLVPMGIARKDAAKFSTAMVQAGADMASFNNASPEETLAAIQSGLAGESEPLRRFGVFLSADRVKAEALSSGLTKVGKTTDQMREAQLKARDASLGVEQAQRTYTEAVKEHGKRSLEARQAQVDLQKAQVALKDATKGGAGALSDAAKAQATYNLIMKDLKSSGAMGDFVRTSDGLANSQRIQAAQWDDLQVKLGQALLPTMQELQKILGRVAGAMSTHTGAVKIAVAVIATLAAGVLAVTVATKVWRAATVVMTATQWLLNAALTANPIGLVIIGLVALAAAIIVAWKRSETFRAIVTGTWNAIRSAALATASIFRDKVWPIISTAIDLIQKHPAWIAIKFAIRNIDDAARAVIGAFTWLRENGASAFGTMWAKIQKPLGLFKTAFDPLVSLVEKLIDAFKWLVGNAGKVGGFFSGIAGKIPGVGDVFDPFFTGPAAAVGAVGGVNLMGANPEMTPFAQLGYSLGLHTTSGFRAGAITRSGHRSDHAVGKALDMADGPGSMAAFFRALIGNPRVKQAFYDPLGSIFGGAWNSYREGGHSDHVHVATYDKGGWLAPRSATLAINNTPRWEPVGPPGRGGDVIVNIHGPVYGADSKQLARELADGIRTEFHRFKRLNGPLGFG